MICLEKFEVFLLENLGTFPEEGHPRTTAVHSIGFFAVLAERVEAVDLSIQQGFSSRSVFFQQFIFPFAQKVRLDLRQLLGLKRVPSCMLEVEEHRSRPFLLSPGRNDSFSPALRLILLLTEARAKEPVFEIYLELEAGTLVFAVRNLVTLFLLVSRRTLLGGLQAFLKLFELLNLHGFDLCKAFPQGMVHG